jgi:hypothetical protein
MERVTSFSWLNLRGDDTSFLTNNAAGGIVHRFTANSTTLLVGDAVFLVGVGIVDKSATASNYVGFVGYVVGGDANAWRKRDAVGTTAATSGQGVMVQISGVARAIVGATGFVAGTNFNAVPSAATAGRIIPGTTADQRIGVALSTQATAGSEVRVLVKHF